MSFFALPKPKVWRRRRKRPAARQRRIRRALLARAWTPQDWFFRLPKLEGGVTETHQQTQPKRRVAPSRLSPAPHLRRKSAMPATRYRCTYRGASFDSDTFDVTADRCTELHPMQGDDVEQAKPTGTLDPYRFADPPGSEGSGPTMPPTNPQDAWTRDKDGTLVPEGTPYDNGPFASLLRFPTRFLPDSLANGFTARAVPVVFWLLVAWVIAKAFRR